MLADRNMQLCGETELLQVQIRAAIAVAMRAVERHRTHA
jgi:hypothetical protein